MSGDMKVLKDAARQWAMQLKRDAADARKRGGGGEKRAQALEAGAERILQAVRR